MRRSSSPFSTILLPWGIPLALGVLIALFFQHSVIVPISISNSHMSPTLPKGKTVYIRKWFSQKALLVGDLVYVEPKDITDRYFIGRIVGKPGDRIEIKSRIPYRNGLPLDPVLFPFLTKDKITILPKEKSQSDHSEPRIVPEKTFYILADNLEEGIDSRELGFIPDAEVKGKVW